MLFRRLSCEIPFNIIEKLDSLNVHVIMEYFLLTICLFTDLDVNLDFEIPIFDVPARIYDIPKHFVLKPLDNYSRHVKKETKKECKTDLLKEWRRVHTLSKTLLAQRPWNRISP